MSEFRNVLEAAGLLPGDIVPDGKRRRCPTHDKPKRRNGQYSLLPDQATGFWRNFADGLGWQVWRDGGAAIAQANPDLLRARREEARRARVNNIMAARALWSQATRYEAHPYITSKGLGPQGTQFLRLWRGPIRVENTSEDGKSFWKPVEDTWLAVPIYWNDRLVNVQRIGSSGLKRQMKGWVPGGSLLLARPTWSVTVIVEGLATGLAVFQSMRSARVLVAFFADNLLPAVQLLKPTGNVVFAADNDHATMQRRGFNPGVDKARNAAELIGAGVAFPVGIEGSDWADAAKEWGSLSGPRIEREILAGARYVAKQVETIP